MIKSSAPLQNKKPNLEEEKISQQEEKGGLLGYFFGSGN